MKKAKVALYDYLIQIACYLVTSTIIYYIILLIITCICCSFGQHNLEIGRASYTLITIFPFYEQWHNWKVVHICSKI